MLSVASVATMAGIAMPWTRIALSSPIAAPMAMPARAAIHGFHPWFMSSALPITVRPNIDPTDRSISRIEIRKAIPAASTPTYTDCCRTFLISVQARKLWCSRPMTTASTIVATSTLLDSISSSRLTAESAAPARDSPFVPLPAGASGAGCGCAGVSGEGLTAPGASSRFGTSLMGELVSSTTSEVPPLERAQSPQPPSSGARLPRRERVYAPNDYALFVSLGDRRCLVKPGPGAGPTGTGSD